MNEFKLSIGYVGAYINDHRFQHLIDIPKEVALKWVQQQFPKAFLGDDAPAEELTMEDMDERDMGWCNKYFIVVGCEHDKWIALYHADGNFSIRVKDV